MKNPQSSMLFWLVICTLVPLGGYVFLRMDSRFELTWMQPTFHFYVVSGASIVAAICSGIIGWLGARLRNANVLLLSLGFMSLSGFFAIHGLSTPGFILNLEMYHLPGVASQLSLTSCAIWFSLSTLSSDNTIVRFISNYSRLFTAGWATLLFMFIIAGLTFPDIADWIPVDSSPVKFVMAFLTIALFLWTGKTYFQQYRFARFPVQITVTYGVIWLSITQIIVITSNMWTISWWMYHLLMIMATGIVLYGVIKQYTFGSPLTESFHTMFSSGLIERIQTGISPSIRALIVATETKDAYTAGHNLRVSMYAIQLADELKLSPELLRALAQGAIVHDVGKLEIPETILNKPSNLTPDERFVVERHPITGYDMCKRLGFMKDELDVIRHHHEKWDGSGYPDKLVGTKIPMVARILAVADVYDALTSERAYRQAWPHERALQFVKDHSGTHFDPLCVEAWSQIHESRKLIFS